VVDAISGSVAADRNSRFVIRNTPFGRRLRKGINLAGTLRRPSRRLQSGGSRENIAAAYAGALLRPSTDRYYHQPDQRRHHVTYNGGAKRHIRSSRDGERNKLGSQTFIGCQLLSSTQVRATSIWAWRSASNVTGQATGMTPTAKRHNTAKYVPTPRECKCKLNELDSSIKLHRKTLSRRGGWLCGA